jgi:hypothetical protein
MRIEIFKAGRQTDSAGNSRDWTESDLDKIVSSYDPKNHEAPVCIGHPKDNAPAWAWVKSVAREGKSLFAEIGDLLPEFSDLLEKKLFKKRSISLYPDLSLRHIGFLGAQPPAVKGLEDFKFSEVEGAPIEYADWQTTWGFKSVGSLFQGLRDWLIDTKDMDTANRLIPQYEIDSLKTMVATPDPVNGFGYSENQTEVEDMDKVKELEAQIVSFGEQITAKDTEINEFKTRATTAEARVILLEKEKVNGELTSFCDRMVNAGKILPAQKGNHMAVMQALAGQAEIEFSEGATITKISPLKAYQDGIENSESKIMFGEFAKDGKDQDDMSDASNIADKARAFKELKSREGMEITISQAVEHVTSKA